MKKSRRRYVTDQTENEKEKFVYVPGTYMRAAAHKRPGPERGVASYRRMPEREQNILIGWLSDIGKKVVIVLLIPKPSSN